MQIEGHDPTPDGEVVDDLDHGRHVVEGRRRIGAHADDATGEDRHEDVRPLVTVEPDPRVQAQPLRVRPQRRERLAVADELEHRVRHVGLRGDEGPRVQQRIQAVLDAHDPDVPDAVRIRIDPGGRGTVAADIGGVADDEDAVVRDAPPLQGDLPVRGVGREHESGRRVGSGFQPTRQTAQGPCPQPADPALWTPLGHRELRSHVVLVEDVRAALEAGQGPEQPEEVRWVASVDDVDPPVHARVDGPRRREGHRRDVLEDVAREPTCRPLRVAQDEDALEALAEPAHVARPAGTDDRHVPPGCVEGTGLLPGAAVQGHGQILDEEQDAGTPGLAHAPTDGCRALASRRRSPVRRPAGTIQRPTNSTTSARPGRP